MKRTTALGLFLVYLSATDAYSYGGRRASVTTTAPIIQAETLPQNTAGLTGIFTSTAKATNQDNVPNSKTSADNKLNDDGYRGLVNVAYHETSFHTKSSAKFESKQSTFGSGISNTELGLAQSNIGLADIRRATTDISNQATGLDTTNSGFGFNRAGIEVADAKRAIDETFGASTQELNLQGANSATGVNSADAVVTNKDEKSNGGYYEGYIEENAKTGLADAKKQVVDFYGDSTSVNQGEKTQIGLAATSSATGKTTMGLDQTIVSTGETNKDAAAAVGTKGHYGGWSEGATESGSNKAVYGGYGGSAHTNHGHVKEHVKVELLEATRAVADKNNDAKQSLGLNESNSGIAVNQVETTNQNVGLIATQNSGGSSTNSNVQDTNKIGLDEASRATSETSVGIEQTNIGSGTTKVVTAAGGHHGGGAGGHDKTHHSGVYGEHANVQHGHHDVDESKIAHGVGLEQSHSSGHVTKSNADTKQHAKEVIHLDEANSGFGINQAGTADHGKPHHSGVYGGQANVEHGHHTIADVNESKIGHGVGIEEISHSSGHVTKSNAETTQHAKEVIRLNEANSGFGINQAETTNQNEGLIGTQNSGVSTSVNQGNAKEEATQIGLNEASGATSKTSVGLEQAYVGTGTTNKNEPAAGHYGGWSNTGSHGYPHHSGVGVHTSATATAGGSSTSAVALALGFGDGLEHTSHSSGFEHKSNKGHGKHGSYGSHGSYGGNGHNYHGHDFHGHDFHGHDFPGHNLHGHDLPGNDYPGHNFAGHNFAGHNFAGHEFPGHDFPGHDFPGNDFHGHNFHGHDFPGHEFPGHEFHGNNFHSTEFQGHDLHGHGGHGSYSAGYGGHGSFEGHNTHGFHSKNRHGSY